jgi:xanthine/uracil permease
MGIFAKFAAALVAIPPAVLGGMTTFLFSAVAVSGIRIISTTPFTRRNRFILTAGLSVGIGATLVPTWFSYVFTYAGDNHALEGFLAAIELVMETGFAVTAFLTLFLNLILPEEIEDEEVPELTADHAEDGHDDEEWSRIQRGHDGITPASVPAKTMESDGSDTEKKLHSELPPKTTTTAAV